MSQVIAVVNQKGGVGKTTTAVNLGAYLAKAGKMVLLVDMDPQGNASSGVGIAHKTLARGVYETLVTDVQFNEVIYDIKRARYQLAPSTLSLAGANVELVNIPRREFRLAEEMSSVRNSYDYVIIDCPPSLSLLTINSLVAADSVLIPVQCEYYALEGLGQLVDTINLVKQNIRPDLYIMGALLTMYDYSQRLSDAVMMEIYKYFPNNIFRTVIPRNIKLAEAPSHGLTILEYDKRCKGAKAYERLSKELIEVTDNGKI
ncbi:MAG: AAA family ATPase [Patescibacteria group bacterium]